MPDVLLFDWRLDKAVESEPTARFAPQYVVIPQIPLKVMLEAPPPTFAMLQKDPLLHQMLVDECKSAFTAALRKIVPALQTFDAECGRDGKDIFKYSASRKRMLQRVDAEIDTAKSTALSAIARRWTQVQQQKREYKSYRLGVGIKIAKGVGGLAAAGAGLAGAVPTGGATLALSVVGAYRALMDGGKVLFDCIQDANAVQKRVQSGLKSLAESYKSAHAKGVGRELAASAANALFKVPLANAATLDNDIKLWNGKLTHLRFLAHYLSTELNKLLENAEQLGMQLASQHASDKMRAALKKVEADVQKLLTDGFVIASMGRRVQIQKSHQDAETGLEAAAEAAKALEALKSGRGAGVDYFDKIIGMVTDAALSVAGNVASPPSSVKDVAGIVSDAAQSLVALNELVVDAAPKVKEAEEQIRKNIQDAVQGKHVEAPGAKKNA